MIKGINTFLLCKAQRRFALYSLMGNIVSGFETSVSTAYLFEAMDLNKNSSIASSYLIRDVISNTSSLYVLNAWSKKVDANSIDSLRNSQIFGQISITADIASLYIDSSLIVPMSGIANVGRSISWVTIGALNARIIQQLAINNNVGELYAKLAIVNTLGQSLGTILGLGYMHLLPDKHAQMLILPFSGILRYVLYKKMFSLLKNN